ncbi:DUF6192 family protein [Nocardia beijingensis]|uniref:DUF6192 family protein n=1 Tax=Nocardia TaxID=1817 RepID=UPI00082A977F|nr:DUF6192 family protein [Nocardia beijingensis]
MPTKIGNVTERQYQRLVQHARGLVEQQSHAQFGLGDDALKVAPMQQYGGAHASEPLMTVSYSIERFANDIGIPPATLNTYRWVSSRWPKGKRRKGVSHYIHRVFAGLDEDDRYEVIKHPPDGEDRWNYESACRYVGWKAPVPRTAQEKVDRIHELAKDDSVATTVTRNFLNRPNVAFEAMADHTARHAVNTAQVDRARQSNERARQRHPVIRKLEHGAEYIELVGMCAQFVAAAGRIVPTLRGHEFTDAERATIHMNTARVRSTTDWIETAVDTGDVSLDEGLARLLSEE